MSGLVTRGRTLLSVTVLVVLTLTAPAAVAAGQPPPQRIHPAVKQPVAVGHGGAVATVDLDASKAAIEILRRGGNAVDAAVAAAATLGVTDPYSAGIGGGGFFVVYSARDRRVHTVDGRETAPQAMRADGFIDPARAEPIPFSEAVTSGLSVGVPGTASTWETALRRWGSISLANALQPSIEVAERGFVVDSTFHSQTSENAERFHDLVSTRELFLPDGQPPPVGSIFRNADLARTYKVLARQGAQALHTGALAAEIVQTVKHPPVDPGATRTVRPGLMEFRDLSAYRVIDREPTHVTYRGLDIFGMAPPSSGGSTVGEALNILENFDLSASDPVRALHTYLESSRVSFADRNRYIGDPGHVSVPLAELLSKKFAKERTCLIDPDQAATSPVPAGQPDGGYESCPAATGEAHPESDEGPATTHLVTADIWGNVVAYSLTIESVGGSGIVVPDRGFLLNNELTDFDFTPLAPDTPGPNLPGPGKRPRSSMSPTVVFSDGRPLLAVGSPGGATIITTVLQILANRFDLGMDLPQALTAPRASQRNSESTDAEPAFIAAHGAALRARGHALSEVAEIGAATGLEFLGVGRFQAVTEPSRRGGGSALVVVPAG